MEHEELTERIIGCAMQVHSTLGPGFLESVYEKALAHALSKAGLRTECQKPITVTYDCIVVGELFAEFSWSTTSRPHGSTSAFCSTSVQIAFNSSASIASADPRQNPSCKSCSSCRPFVGILSGDF
jgi:hypothetical protein